MLYWKENLEKTSTGNSSSVIRRLRSTVEAFKRPSELVTSPSLWGSHGVSATGIKQGSLGDCWFLAACAALAEYPERIQSIFKSEFTSSGIMQFNFYEKGSKKIFNIDDKLPVNRYGSLVISRTSDNGAWWVPMIEKAAAKFNVNYI